MRTPWLPALIFVLTPVVIHVGRVNFGHAPSIFLLATGYVLYLHARTKRRLLLAAAGGACFGIAAYGYPGFYVAIPLFLTILTVSELVFSRKERESLRPLIITVLVSILCYTPILAEAKSNPDFSNRFEQKDTVSGGLVSFDRVMNMIESYPKYFSFEFLFAKGETGLSDGFIQRHSVTGAGLLYWIELPLIGFGILSLLLAHTTVSKRAFIPFLLLAALFPLPDLITTDTTTPPYTFSVYTGILCVPFLAAYGLITLSDVPHNRSHMAMAPITTIVIRLVRLPTITTLLLVSAFFFVFSTYALYPNVSSGYWGWQSGPREMIGYYSEYREYFSGLTIEGKFNEPATLVDFYAGDKPFRSEISVGSPVNLTSPEPTRLYGVTKETFSQSLEQDNWIVRHIVYYPDGSVAFYLVTARSVTDLIRYETI